MERTPDGRHIVVGGRRWRATDPEIPEDLRRQLVGELMDARRAVARADDEAAVASARARVHDAKVALGERGTPWWDRGTPIDIDRAHSAARSLLRRRAPESTICPSEVARIVASPSWRANMEVIRSELDSLVRAGELERRQRGRPIPVEPPPTGPVRYGRGARFPAPPD